MNSNLLFRINYEQDDSFINEMIDPSRLNLLCKIPSSFSFLDLQSTLSTLTFMPPPLSIHSSLMPCRQSATIV